MEIKGGYCNRLYPNQKIRKKNINIKYDNLQVNIFQTKKKTLTKYLYHATQDLRKLCIVSKILYTTNLEKLFFVFDSLFLVSISQFGETRRQWHVNE